MWKCLRETWRWIRVSQQGKLERRVQQQTGHKSTTMWTPMTTLTHRTSTIASRITTCIERARIVSQSLIITLTFMAQAESCTFHTISMPSIIALDVSLWLDLLHSLLLSLPLVCPFFHLSDEQQLELYKKDMENLRNYANNGGEGTYDVLYLRTGCGPKLMTSPSPSRSLSRTRTWMTWHSARCSVKRTEDNSITSHKEACQSVSCCCLYGLIDQGNRMERDRSNPMSVTARKHRLGLYLRSKERHFYRGLSRKSQSSRTPSSSSRRRAPTPTRTTMATEIGISGSSSTKSNRDGRITEIPEFCLRYARKTEAHRGPEHCFGIFRQNTRTTKWSELYEPILDAEELQNEVNCMNDSKDFQDAESVRCGNAHVTSPLGLFPRYFHLKDYWSQLSYRSDKLRSLQISGIHPVHQETFLHIHILLHQLRILRNWTLFGRTLLKNQFTCQQRRSGRPERDQDLRCQSGPSAKGSVIFSGGDSSKNYGADQQRLQISDLHFDKFPTPATFACWKISFKTEVCTCSQFPTEAMQWIKEVELVESVDELRSSSSTRGFSMPNFEVLDARIASALNKIIHISHFKKKNQSGGTKGPEAGAFPSWHAVCLLDLRFFRVTGTDSSVENYTDLFTIALRNDDVQEFDSKWDGILLSMTKIPPDDILEGLYKLRIQESEKLQTVLELYDLETHQKKLGPD